METERKRETLEKDRNFKINISSFGQITQKAAQKQKMDDVMMYFNEKYIIVGEQELLYFTAE